MRESVCKLMIDAISKRLAKAQPVITSSFPTVWLLFTAARQAQFSVSTEHRKITVYGASLIYHSGFPHFMMI